MLSLDPSAVFFFKKREKKEKSQQQQQAEEEEEENGVMMMMMRDTCAVSDEIEYNVKSEDQVCHVFLACCHYFTNIIIYDTKYVGKSLLSAMHPHLVKRKKLLSKPCAVCSKHVCEQREGRKKESYKNKNKDRHKYIYLCLEEDNKPLGYR